MATAEISVIPVGREGAGVSDVIAVIRRRLEEQDRVKFEMGGMGTSLEGDIDAIFEVCKELHQVPLESGIPRAYTIIKIDQRTDREQGLDDKLSAVDRHR